MLFPTIEFAVFFAIVFPVTWLLNPFNSCKKWFLVAASYYFYAFWKIEYVALLVVSSVVDFSIALLLGKLHDGRLRLAVLWLGVAVNLGVLGYFKYYNFFLATLVNLLDAARLDVPLNFAEMALPIAISFLTFHALSYIIDVYRRELPPTRSLVDVLLYFSFFPHLIAGPIVRAKKFLAQTIQPSTPADIRLAESVFLILGGLFKKVIIANYLATDFVDNIFRVPADYSSLDLLLGTYAYGLQIYCDFSAYTDIAIGVANLLGYEFPQNFNQPYRAASVRDFWRRWHMSLSSWLRDYLYIPLGGSKRRIYRNLMITMALGGLWHGASFNFVIWGVLHGFALVIEHGLGWTLAADAKRAPVWAAARWLVTFNFVCLAWVFFRSPSLDASIGYFSALFTGASFGTTMTPFVAVMMILGAATQFIPQRWEKAMQARYDAAWWPVQVAVPFSIIYLIAVVGPTGVPPFIYFQF
jgi:D-alanyl-lipoteichoic acid acyltransferase DltB (MBOAT superfamily)